MPQPITVAHHYAALKYCEAEKNVAAVEGSIKFAVPQTNPEYRPLMAAVAARRQELKEQAAQAAAKKAQEEAEKAGAHA